MIVFSINESEAQAMAQRDQEKRQTPDAQVTLRSDLTSVSGDIIYDDEGLILKINSAEVLDRPELLAELEKDEQPVALWARLADRTSGKLLQEGQELTARVRVRLSDGRFTVKAAAVSLGVVAAIVLGSNVIKKYHPR